MKKSELREMIRECLHEELSNRKLQESVSNRLYVVFNYYPVKYSTGHDLDSFYLHTATLNKAEALDSLIAQSFYRVANFGDLQNTLVCFEINPAEYDCTVDDFYAAEGEGGQDLHWEYRDIVYTLDSIVDSETPLYTLSTGDILGLYEDFIVEFGDELALSVDDLYVYGNSLNISTVKIIQSHAKFNPYVEKNLTITI